MTVNSSYSVAMVLLIALMATLSGCGASGEPPHLSYLVAASRLRPDGETRRLDVVCDVRNTNNIAYHDVKLTVTFMDHTEAVFEWPEVPAFGLKGAHTSLELKIPVTQSDMLGGSFETLLDEHGGMTSYATEVKGAVLVFRPADGSRHEKEIGLAASRCIRESFEKLSKGESSRMKRRKERLNRLNKAIGGNEGDEGS